MPPWSIKNVNLLGIIELISAYETACTICARIVVALEPKAEAPNDEDVKLIVNTSITPFQVAKNSRSALPCVEVDTNPENGAKAER
jgi:hypothetical protein